MPTIRPCRACGVKICNVKGPGGKYIPLDMEAPVYEIRGGAAFKANASYVSHFCTCPKASSFSKAKTEVEPVQQTLWSDANGNPR